MSNKTYVSIIVPVYNEERVIGKVLDNIKKILKRVRKKSEIIVINDGSTDKSASRIKKKKVKLIQHKINKGYGAALKTGIRAAKGEYILITDADGTYSVSDIPKLIRLSSKYDMVIGARTGKHIVISFPRKAAKWFLNKLTNYLCDMKIPDMNSGLRVFKKDLALRFFNLFPNGFSFTTTITVAALTNDYNVKFIPINYYKRKGKSSIHPIKDFTGFVYLIIKLMTYFRPLKIFLPTSFFLLTIGLLKAFRDYILFGWFGVGAAILLLTALQIGFLGLISDLIIKRTRL